MARHYKAQVAIEYIMVFGMGLLLLGILLIFTTQESGRTRYEIDLTYAKNAVGRVVDTAELVYIQGPPAQTHVTVFFPDNVESITITGSTITFAIRYTDYTNNVSRTSDIAVMNGTLSPLPGTHRVLVRALQGTVEITDA